MAGKNTAVCGIYPTHSSLEVGVQVLKESGFRRTDISVLYPTTSIDKGATHKKIVETAPEGAATGAGAGALVGGILGELARVGFFSIPGLGHFIAAGPITALLTGVGGAVGGLAGGLIGLGVSEREANTYQERLKEGRTLLSVQPDNAYWRSRAREILEKTGALEISPGEADAGMRTSECTSTSA
jgi:hypothetical protein